MVEKYGFCQKRYRQKLMIMLPFTQLLPVLLLVFSLSMLMKIFLSRSHPAPDMPLGFIRIQNLASLPGQGRVDLEEPFGNVLMCGCDYFERFLYPALLTGLQPVWLHPVPNLPAVSGKCPHFHPCPLQSFQ